MPVIRWHISLIWYCQEPHKCRGRISKSYIDKDVKFCYNISEYIVDREEKVNGIR